MPNFRISPLARKDLADSYAYILRGSVKQGDIVIEEFYQTFEKLSSMPNRGSKREGLPKFRFWVLHSYLIIYEPDVNPIRIIRIISAYRDIDSLLH